MPSAKKEGSVVGTPVVGSGEYKQGDLQGNDSLEETKLDESVQWLGALLIFPYSP